MEETTLWNKKMSDLTVGDNMKINFVGPAVMVGGMAVGTLIVGVVSAGFKKLFQKAEVPATEATE